ncbi:MAG: NUDIX domain-containing protein [Candidatus Paceibacterota bacterium]|jgi:ADP-ribose pyrophosphatase YjhB (NUDIX family)
MKEQKQIEIVLRAIIVINNKLLMCVLHDQPPVHFLPGGHLEFGETLEDGLKREIKEEMGVEIKSMEFLKQFENIYEMHGIKHHEINLVHKVSLNIERTEEIKAQEDHISFTWVGIEKIKDIKMLPPVILRYLVEYFSGKAS